jgi:hypothetical protein
MPKRTGLGHFRWFDYRRVITALQEIPPEINQAFHSLLLMGFNTESEQDPKLRTVSQSPQGTLETAFFFVAQDAYLVYLI